MKKHDTAEILRILSSMTPEQRALYNGAANASNHALDQPTEKQRTQSDTALIQLDQTYSDLETVNGLLAALADELMDFGTAVGRYKREPCTDNQMMIAVGGLRDYDTWAALLHVIRQTITAQVAAIEKIPR